MISYPCFPPLSRRDSTKRSRKFFTIRSLTARVILSQGNYRSTILSSFNISTPLKRLSRTDSRSDKVEPRDRLSGVTMHRMPLLLFERRKSSEVSKVRWAAGYNNQSRDSQREIERRYRSYSIHVEIQRLPSSRCNGQDCLCWRRGYSSQKAELHPRKRVGKR